jgi:hypothetical protein
MYSSSCQFTMTVPKLIQKIQRHHFVPSDDFEHALTKNIGNFSPHNFLEQLIRLVVHHIQLKSFLRVSLLL